MPEVAAPSTWQEVAVAFAVLAVAAFLVTWLITDVLGIRRTAYIAILALMVAGLSAAYLAWSDVSGSELITSNALWGAVGGIIAAAVVFPLVRRLPAQPHATGSRLGVQLLWEGGIYGIAEALLLATLPVLVIWQGVPDGAGEASLARVGWGALAIFGSLVVILVHHLGYAEFRMSSGRTKLMGALLSCGIQALAFLLTGSILAPVIAHILLHTQMIVRGTELPPAQATTRSAAVPAEQAPTSADRREPLGV